MLQQTVKSRWLPQLRKKRLAAGTQGLRVGGHCLTAFFGVQLITEALKQIIYIYATVVSFTCSVAPSVPVAAAAVAANLVPSANCD